MELSVTREANWMYAEVLNSLKFHVLFFDR